jgi:tRNA threonylcarbamoyladenosine biosynthesis protein TsaE
MIIEVNNTSELTTAASLLIGHYGDKRVFAFHGIMGAGKTTFIKAVCKLLGTTDEVNSPTFSLINEYGTNLYGPLYHFDFYRINKIEEAYDIGYENYFYSGNYCFVEWPEKIGQLLPHDCVKVFIEVDESDQKRILNVTV